MNATVQKVANTSDQKEIGSIIAVSTVAVLVHMKNAVLMVQPIHFPVTLVQRSKAKVNLRNTICQTTPAAMQMK